MAGRVAGKVAVVTGAAQGIGHGIAARLAAEGALVVIGDIQREQGEAVAQALREQGSQAQFVAADVSQEADCAALIEAAINSYGRLDILVNNAGSYPRATLEETSVEFWDAMININLRSAFLCCKFAVPHMQRIGGGSIVNIGSINGIQGLPNLIAYAAAKGGLLTLTRTLAGAYAKDRIRANYIIPGWVLSEGEVALHASRGLSHEALLEAGRALPLGRHQTPEDTASAVLYLASDEAAQVTGTILHIDAGATTLPIPPQAPYLL